MASTSADYSEMGLEKVPPISSQIRKLDLSSNKLGSSQGTFEGLEECAPSLTWLDLKSNKLSSLAGLNCLKMIQVLNLSHNQLASIATIATFSTNLKALILNNNVLTTLPDLSPLINLNTLVLSHNNITTLPNPFPALQNLKKLSISHNLLQEYPRFPVSPALQIQELRLSHNKLSSLPIKNPPSYSTYTLPALKTLDLGSNLLLDLQNLVKGLKVVCGNKDGGGQLVNLNLKGNPATGVVYNNKSKTTSDSNASPETENHEESPLHLAYKEAVLPACGPHLKILDGVRFDSKFLERREKRKESGWMDKQKLGSLVNGNSDDDPPGKRSSELVAKSNNLKVSNPEQSNLTENNGHRATFRNSNPRSVTNVPKQAERSKQDQQKSRSGSIASSFSATNTKTMVKRSSKDVDNVAANLTRIPPKAMKRKAEDQSPESMGSASKRKSNDEFFVGSFNPAVSTEPVSNQVLRPELSNLSVKGKVEEKKEEKMRSGVVAVIERKQNQQMSKGVAVEVKSITNIDELISGNAVSGSIGTGLAPGWD